MQSDPKDDGSQVLLGYVQEVRLGRKSGSYKFEKRQKELRKQKKKREKMLKRQNKEGEDEAPTEPSPDVTPGIR